MDSKVKPKEKRRNSERRKEKSRVAARCRRTKETDIFKDMASLLPLPTSTISSLDKASIMRLAISFLKTKNILDMIPLETLSSPSLRLSSPSSSPSSAVCRKDDPGFADALFLKALDGFLLVISTDGDLVFVSENVNEHLGLSHIDLMGQSIYDLTHPCDHSEVKSVLSTKEIDIQDQKSIFIRLKCTLTSKGRSVNVKAASYKVIHCIGHLVKNENVQEEASVTKDDNNNQPDPSKNQDSEGEEDAVPNLCHKPTHCFVAIGEPIPHPANYEIPLSKHTFLTKHSLDMKFTYADDTMEEFLKFIPETFISKSFFEYHHAQDSFHVQNSFKNLFSKGQCQTDRYRFLACGGGYIWVLTQATLIYSKGQKAQSVVCVNFVMSEIEHPDEIFAICQLPKNKVEVKSRPTQAVTAPVIKKPIVATSSVFLPKPVSVQNPVQKTLPVATVAPLPAVPLRVVSNASKPAIPLEPKPIAAPLEEILPLPEGFVIPKVSNPPIIGPVAVSTLPLQDNTNKDTARSGTNVVASKFLASLKTNDPLLQAITAENNVLAQAPRPQPATSKIFAPRTKEMNKGYLMFADDDTGLTMLKDEPEDLTHLAPTAGDVCVPLDNHQEMMMGDLFDEFILPDPYPLLSDEESSSKLNMSPQDSFINYRDDRSLSPTLTHSPGACSVPSLSSIEDSPPCMMYEDTSMSSLWGFDLGDPTEDLSIRAPYISMGEDLPLLNAGDLMWGSHNVPKPISHNNSSQSNGVLSSNANKHSWSKNSNSHSHSQSSAVSNNRTKCSPDDTNSSLAKLLRADSNSKKTNFVDGGGGTDNINQILKFKYVTKKDSSTVLESSPSTISINKKNGKRCATTPEWDHRGYWKRSKTPSPQQQQIPSSKHNSVLMNLLVSGCDKSEPVKSKSVVIEEDAAEVSRRTRLKSLTSMDDSDSITSAFGNLTNQDYEVNAPTSNLLLGDDLLSALEYKT